MPEIFSILAANGATWGVTLTLIIAGLIVAIVILNRDNRRQDAEIEKLKTSIEERFKKIEDDKKEAERVMDSKLDQIFNKVNKMAEDVAVLKDRDNR